jgi:general stress protein 26
MLELLIQSSFNKALRLMEQHQQKMLARDVEDIKSRLRQMQFSRESRERYGKLWYCRHVPIVNTAT